MGFFYEIQASQTTSGSADTETQAGRLLTVANQRTCLLRRASMQGRETAAGGAFQRLKRASVAGTVGAAYTPDPRRQANPAAGTTAFTAHTAGTIAVVKEVIGSAATGGMGLWIALSDDEAIQLAPNGGAGGNMEATNIAGVASVDLDWVWLIEEM